MSDGWYFTLLLTVFTGGLLCVGIMQSWLLWKSFYAEYWPRIQIRQIKPLTDPGDLSDIKAPFEFEVLIMNNGSSRARIVQSDVAICFDRPEWPLLKNTQNIGAISGSINPGDEQPYRFSADYDKYGISPLMVFKHSSTAFYVIGFVQYRGWLSGRKYKTAFCRRYVRGDRLLNIQKAPDRFIALTDPEYEYTD